MCGGEEKMNALVFGGTRFMGKHLVKELIEMGYNVTIATRGIMNDDFGNKISRLIVDRTDAKSLQKNIPDTIYDVIFDNIAYCSNDVKYLLSTIKCRRYIQVSSASVYTDLHNNTREEEFDANNKPLIYCDKNDFPYGEIKRQAECAITQDYSHISSVMVRFPFVIGTDDYTERLYFYVDHIINQKPMFVDNLESKMAFVRSDEAGKFLAFVAGSDFKGAINGASEQTISMKEVVCYIKSKTGKSPILCNDGEKAPYNGASDYYLNVDKVKSLGFSFTPLTNWIYDLIDSYIIKAGL